MEVQEAATNKAFEIGKTLKLKLYPYQEKIVRYCLNKQHAIIVAPCGSGKTPIALAAFIDMKRTKQIDEYAKGLIVVKSSLKIQWLKEIKKFSDLKANIIDTFNSATTAQRARLKKKEKQAETTASASELKQIKKEITLIKREIKEKFASQFDEKYDLYITNYEALRDPIVRKKLHSLNLQFMCCDEIHYIKSDTALRSKAIYEFNNLKVRIGTTATPIQKGPMDAFSISKFISPDTFKSKSEYQKRYVRFSFFNNIPVPSGSKNEAELNKRLSDYMIVIGKEEVSKHLPSVTVLRKYCKLTEAQENVTEQLLDEIKDLKEEENEIHRRYNGKPTGEAAAAVEKLHGNIMARQTFASELADSEKLLSDSDSFIAKQYCTGSDSNKIQLLLDLLYEIFESGEKAAVFSKYAKLQPILEEAVKKAFKSMHIEIAKVNGAMSPQERYNEVYKKFKENSNCRLLLLSDAGAEGLNLSNCKFLIEMEPADSYMIQTQRRGRIERADSIHQNVFVYQLLAENSYDEIAIKIVKKKERFDKSIIKGINDESAQPSLFIIEGNNEYVTDSKQQIEGKAKGQESETDEFNRFFHPDN